MQIQTNRHIYENKLKTEYVYFKISREIFCKKGLHATI